MKKGIVIINEQHSLTQEQIEQLNKGFEKYEFLKVPAEGWALEEIIKIVENLDLENEYIFVSPVPVLLAKLAQLCDHIYIFHNDKREKKELPNGKVVYSISNTGWRLLKI